MKTWNGWFCEYANTEVAVGGSETKPELWEIKKQRRLSADRIQETGRMIDSDQSGGQTRRVFDGIGEVSLSVVGWRRKGCRIELMGWGGWGGRGGGAARDKESSERP